MRNFYLILFALVIATSCSTVTKEKENDIYVTEKPPDPASTPAPGDFVVSASKITDQSITLDWTKPTVVTGDKLSYSIAKNDSVILYNLTQNTYTLNNLIPDKDYTFKVVALNSTLNKNVVPITVHTQKSFIESVTTFNYALKKYNFERVVKTTDNGYLVYGDLSESGLVNKMFLMKLSANFSIIWKNQFSYPTGGLSDTQMIECSDHNIIFVSYYTVYKFDPQGNIIWAYQKTSNVRFFQSIAENSDGCFYLIGHAPNAAYPTGYQYVVVKLDANGSEIFQKTITVEGPVRIKQIMIDGNNLVVLGTISDAQLFITKLDLSGNLISSQKFFNKYYSYCTEDPYSMVVTKDNNYLVMTTLNGPIYSSAYTDLPRYFKVSKSGMVIWDQYQNLSSGGYDSNINGIDVLDNGKYLTIINDDEGLSIVLLNELGNVERQYKLHNYQEGMFIDMNAQGKYVYFTVNLDEIFLMNPAGYWAY